MPSSYSQNLGLELIGDGEQSGIWGDTTNYNLGTLLEQAITGVQSITVGGSNVTLSNFQGLSNEARNAVLYVTGSPGAVRTVFIPAGQSKTYIVYNGVSGGFSLNVYVTGQTSGVTIPNGATILMYTNGTQSFLVSPTTAANPTVATFTGYVTGTQLNVTSGTVTVGQVIYNPAFITGGNPSGSATVTVGTTNPYTLTYPGTAVNIGSASVAPNQPFVSVTTPAQIATFDYIQNKTQSVFLGGTPTTPTATASVFEGYVTGSVLVVTALYPNSGGVSPGYFINGNNITAGSFVQANGTGSTLSSVFTGYISAGAGLSTAGTTLTVTGISSGTLAIGQYIDSGNTVIGTTLASGSGLSWGVSGTAQLVGSPTNPVVFRGFGAGTGATGWYTLNTPSTNVNVTPIVAFLQPTQIANMTLFSYVSYLVGSLGAQDFHNVNITGGTINGVTFAGTLNTSTIATTQAAKNNSTAVATTQYVDSAATIATPPGAVMAFAMNAAPAGWLTAAGQGVSTTTYAALFAAIGYQFGGSGGTFNLPDLRGYFVRGVDNGRGVDSGRPFGSSQDATGIADQVLQTVTLFNDNIDGPLYGGVVYNSSGGLAGTNRNIQKFKVRPYNVALLYCIKI
jgi:hypothetical protein